MVKDNFKFLIFAVLAMVLVLSIGLVSAQSAVNLGTAGDFVILSKSGISTTGVTSIVGDIGVSPIGYTAITGFGLIMDSSNQFSTSSLITGKVYAPGYAIPTPTKVSTAVGDMETAYTDAAGRTLPDYTELYSGDLSGRTLTPGLYKWGTGVIINSGVTLNCLGNTNAVFIFQVAQDLIVGNGAIVGLSNGCQARNVFWQVAGQTTLGTTSQFKGIILDKTNIAIQTGAILDGRALAQTAVTLEANGVSIPAPVIDNSPAFNSGNPSNKTLDQGVAVSYKINASDDYGVSCFRINDTTNFNINCAGLLTNKTVLSPNVYSLNVTVNDTINQKTSAMFYINVTNIVCTSNLQNTTWSSWLNQTSCRINSTVLQNRSLIRYDLNKCVSNTTLWEYKEIACTITSPTTEVKNVGSEWKNNDYNITLNSTTSKDARIIYINYTLNNVSGRIDGNSGNILINTSGNNTLTFYAVDNLSNAESPNTMYILLDKESPQIISFILSDTSVVEGENITGTCNVTDNLYAGITGVITGIDTSTIGTKTAICTATDLAGNIATAYSTYDVNLQSSSGGNGGHGGSYCTTEWDCTEWDACNAGFQIRTCAYPLNWCTPTEEKPIESQSCTLLNPMNITSNSPSNGIKAGLAGITGAVIGGGLANNLWIWIVVGLIVLASIFFLIRYLVK